MAPVSEMIEAVAELGSWVGVGLGVVGVANTVLLVEKNFILTIYYYSTTPSEALVPSLFKCSAGSTRGGACCCFNMAILALGACVTCMA